MTGNAPLILVVDDEPQNRRLLEALLLPEGYRTVCAGDGREALAIVADDAPDLILLDIMMPGMDGYEVARNLKANPATANIPIIMVTAQIDRDARLRGLDAGAEDFLLKPVDRAELWLRVRNHLRLKAYGDLLQGHAAVLETEVQSRTADLQRFRSAMDATADAIFLTNRTTMRLVEVNQTATTMLGYSREELLAAAPFELRAAVSGPIEATYDALIAGSDDFDVVETTIRHRDGSLRPVEISLHAQLSGSDWIIVSVMTDITARKEAEERLQRLAHYDALTNLPNRTLFYETLETTVESAKKHRWTAAVLFIDIDHFKDVNDSLGHAHGDELLRQFGDRLSGCVRVRDTIGRLGGDEFAVILVMETAGQDAAGVAKKIQERMRAPFDLFGREVSITASVGITVFPDDATDSATLLKYADTAMYRAKRAGRDTARFFTAQMNIDLVARVDLERDLRDAVANNEFVLHYQPKVDLSTGRIDSAEALLRWEKPGVGLVPPLDFVSVLEENGLIIEVGSWVIDSVCGQIARWAASPTGPVRVAINVCARQLEAGDLEEIVASALRKHNVAPDLLELELTESSLMANTERTVASLCALKELGVQISIDDFGTGYSSLAYLSRFPIDTLKIDRAFVRDITVKREGAEIVLAIVSLAHSLRKKVVAEGVETEAQVAYLRQHGCDQIQGYLFSRPVPARALEEMIRSGKRLPAVSPRRERPEIESFRPPRPSRKNCRRSNLL